MKHSSAVIFFMLSLAASLPPHCSQPTTFVSGKQLNRRILHQPLFPSTSASPPARQDQQFFHGQGQQSPPPPEGGGTQLPTIPASGEGLSKAKKIAIATSSGILTLAMVSALAFYLYRHCAVPPDEQGKLVGGNSVDDSRMPPSNFLYIGTVEPSSRSFVEDSSTANSSPYRKLNSGRRTYRYRPSPDLQPLPPLPRPRSPPQPPPIWSSDDDSHDTDFYTPQGSSMGNESPISRHGYLSPNLPENRGGVAVPRTKGNSPKTRFSAPSPDKKPVMIPSIKQSLPPSAPPPPRTMLGPLQTSKTRSYKRANFTAPPPPSDRANLKLINGDDRQKPRIPNPPPPPIKIGAVQTHNPSPTPISKQEMKPEAAQNLTPKSNSKIEKTNPIDGATNRDGKDGSRPKLKPLHWDKVRATSDRATVWDQLNSTNSFQLNEDAMESLFGYNPAISVPPEVSRGSVVSTMGQEYRVLDPKKSQNIAILLRALNVTIEEVSEALLDGNTEGLGTDLLETLVKMAPTKEEEIKLKQYKGEISRLGSAERFLKAILDIPFAFKRVEAMLYRANFDTEVAYLRKSFRTLEEASEELMSSRLFLKLLEAVLRTGNRMNDGTNRGDARAFKLDTLLKLVDVKGTDGKTTLLHFVVQEMIRSEGATSNPTGELDKPESKFKDEDFKKQGLQLVSGLSQELGNVKRAAGMDSDVLSSYVAKLDTGIEKVKSVMQYEKEGKFFDSMKDFLNEAGKEILKIKAEEREVLSVVKDATEYFHGDAAKEESHPLRIFLIVRDFLAILDKVCRDVERMQGGQATMGAGRSFRTLY